MSIKTWKKKHYPVTAEDADQYDSIALIQHCINKWEGLLPEAVAKHKLKVGYGGDLYERDDMSSAPAFVVDAESCALCVARVHHCQNCEITKATGKPCAGYDGVFSKWVENYNPLPMLATLYETLGFYKAKEGAK